MRLLLPDDAGVRRDRHLAVGEGVKRVDGLVGRLVGRDLNDDLHLVGRIVVDLADLDLALFVGLDDRLLDRLGGRRIGDLGDGQRALVDLRNAGADLHGAAAQTVVVAAHVGHAARREVGPELELASLEMGDAGVDELHEVVGQNLRREAHGDAVRPLGEQQRELDRKRHGLLVAAVVGTHPLRGFLVEHHIVGELRQTGLDVTARSGLVAREDVAPVALTVDQQILLPQLDQGVLDRGVAVRVVLHGLADDVGDLVVAAVVHALHGVQDAALHGLQTVLDMGHGTLQDHVGGIVEEPVLVHARKLAHAALLLDQAVVLPLAGGRIGGSGIVGGRLRGHLVDRFGHRTLPVRFLLGIDSIFIGHILW